MERRKPLKATKPLIRKTPLRPGKVEQRQLNSRVPLSAASEKGRNEGPGRDRPTPGAPPIPRRKRLNPVGAKAKRQAAYYEAQKVLLWARCRDTCELCARKAVLDPHHVFGRTRAGVPWELLYSVDCLAGICRDCHTRVTDHPRSSGQKALEWTAVIRVARAGGIDVRKNYADRDFEPWTPLQILRDVVRNNRISTLDKAA